jgi:hypothetical protein
MQSVHELAAEICTLAGRLNAANHRFLLLIAEFDRRNGWNDGATKTCAHWLNWKCGIGMGAAREKVRVAHALAGLPKVSAAMAAGTLSYSKVREITRVASAETEDTLLMVAEHGTAQHVERLVQSFRRCKDAEELSREARQQRNRRVSIWHDHDGSLILDCRLPAEIGAAILQAIDLAVEDVPAGTSRADMSFSARRADALWRVAQSFLAHGAKDANGGERQQIVVHVAAETLQEKTAGCCQLEHGPSLAAETARRLACDASVVALFENVAGEPVDVGRKTRTISAPLRRLLDARDKGCRFPGCANKRYIDAHHIKHWANGGETKPSNLVCLCTFHHRAVHEGGMRVERLDDGALRFVKADGDVIGRDGFNQPASDWTELKDGMFADTWRGERMDLGLAVEVLLQQSRRGENVPAGTLGNGANS